MKTFWTVLILAILFVVGSASALNYIGNRAARRGQDKTGPDNRDEP